MAPQPDLTLSSTQPQNVQDTIAVNENTRYQQFTGLGAAMTDSSAWLICNKMSAPQRGALMQELFGQSGPSTGLAAPPIHLNFLRVGVAATGAMTDTTAYSYDDNPPGGSDPNLTSFSISHDQAYIIPALQQALQIDSGLEILASPWSPPGWMKGNGTLDNKNNTGTLLTQYYGTYAQYLVKFIQAYANAGIPIAALTPANEPTTATQYPGLQLSESQEAQFISQDLQPALSHSRPEHEDLRQRPELGPVLGIREPARFEPRAARSERHRLALLLRLADGHDPAPPAGAEPRSDRRRVLARDQVVRNPGVPDLDAAQLGQRRRHLERRARPQRKPDPDAQLLRWLPRRGLDRPVDRQRDVPPRVLPARPGQRVRPARRHPHRLEQLRHLRSRTAPTLESITSGLDDVAFQNPDGSKVLVANNNSSSPISFAVETDGNYFSYTIPAGAMTTFEWQ